MRHIIAIFFTAFACATAGLSQDAQSAGSSQNALPLGEQIVELPDGAGTDGGVYVECEFLLRWFKPVCAGVPILTIGDPQDPTPGAIGQPGTRVVVGGSPPHKFEFPASPGVQVTVGSVWCDGTIGLEFSGFVCEQAANSQHFTADPSGFPFTYLPYTAPDNSAEALPFTIPNVVTGGSVAVGSTKIWGTEGNLTAPFIIDRGKCTAYGRLTLGGRYLDLTDRVRIHHELHLVDDPVAMASGAAQFSTHNRFAGPQVGTTLGLDLGICCVELTTKISAGLTHQTRNIDGSPLLTTTLPSPLLVPGPIQALPSNVGHETARRVTLVPEIGVKSQLAFASWCSVSLGYSLLYWNKVLCPGDQMSPLVNVTQLPFRGPESGPRDPKPLFVHTDYFAHGANLGIEFRR